MVQDISATIAPFEYLALLVSVVLRFYNWIELLIAFLCWYLT